jgi:hypothetical protein
LPTDSVSQPEYKSSPVANLPQGSKGKSREKAAELAELAERLADGMGCGAVVLDLEGDDE